MFIIAVMSSAIGKKEHAPDVVINILVGLKLFKSMIIPSKGKRFIYTVKRPDQPSSHESLQFGA
jgi:hypothetical protein